MNARQIVYGVLALGVGLFSLVAIPHPEWWSSPSRPPAPHALIQPAGLPVAAAWTDELPSLDGATGWIHSPPLSPAALRGKVVLVEFWTYTCINWRREFPYVRAWASKYRTQGLVVIGVHTPEFEFEERIDHVRRAASAIGVDHPIALDSRRAVWTAFRNSYWPALYFIDAQGRVRHRHFGEGDYEQSERVLQQLLKEAGAEVGSDLVTIEPSGAEAPADWKNLRSPETYVGSALAVNFASPGGFVTGRRRDYEQPPVLLLNQWALSGAWTVRPDAAASNEPNARLSFSFHARDLHLVMGPSVDGAAVRYRVLVDGKPPGRAHGVDVDDQGLGSVVEPRMYQLIRQPGPVRQRRFEIEFLDPGVEVYSFTFG